MGKYFIMYCYAKLFSLLSGAFSSVISFAFPHLAFDSFIFRYLICFALLLSLRKLLKRSFNEQDFFLQMSAMLISTLEGEDVVKDATNSRANHKAQLK